MNKTKNLIEKEKELENKLNNYEKDTQEYNNICDGLDEVRSDLIVLGF